MAVKVIGLFFAVTVVVGVSGARLRRWADGAGSSASSFAGSSAGGMGAFAGTGFPNNGFIFPGFQPQPFLTPQDIWLQYQQFQNAYANSVNPGYGGSVDGSISNRILPPNGGSSSASAVIGPNGGFGTINGVGFRIGDYDEGSDLMTRGGPDSGASFNTFSTSSNPGNGGGGTYGTFSSSSSSQQTVDGKTRTQQQATFGTNDNGRITFKTFRNP